VSATCFFPGELNRLALSRGDDNIIQRWRCTAYRLLHRWWNVTCCPVQYECARAFRLPNTDTHGDKQIVKSWLAPLTARSLGVKTNISAPGQSKRRK
jgi:hypothetical protein